MCKTMEKLTVVLLLVALTFGQTCSAQASAKKDIDMALKYYKAGKLKKAETYVKKLPKKANRSPVKKLSAKEKKAYKAVVKKYQKKYEKNGSDWFYYLHGYYFADMDGDKKTELLIHHGWAPIESVLTVFKYQSGKAKKVAETYCSGHTSYYAYPGHKGILFLFHFDGHEEIGSYSLSKGKLRSKSYNSRVLGEYGYEGWFALRQPLDSHIRSKETGKYQYKYWISWKDLNQ